MFSQLSGPQVDRPGRRVQEPRGGVELVRGDRDLRLCELKHGTDLGLRLRPGRVLCERLTPVLIFGAGGLLVDSADSLFGESVRSPGLVAFPPRTGPYYPPRPGIAVAHVLAVVGDESLRVAEVCKVITPRRLGAPVAVNGDVCHVLGRLVPRHTGGDLLYLLRLERGLAALLVRHLERRQDLPFAHAAPAHAPSEACEDFVALPGRYALSDWRGRPLRALPL